MLKDRKFWTGMLVGVCLMGGVSVLQPTIAADAKDNSAMMLKVLKVGFKGMINEQKRTNQLMTELKQEQQNMSRKLSDLTKSQTFNQPAAGQPRNR